MRPRSVTVTVQSRPVTVSVTVKVHGIDVLDQEVDILQAFSVLGYRVAPIPFWVALADEHLLQGVLQVQRRVDPVTLRVLRVGVRPVHPLVQGEGFAFGAHLLRSAQEVGAIQHDGVREFRP